MMKIRFFKLDKNKKFNYTPRHYEGKKVEKGFKLEEAIRKDRETQTESLITEWQKERLASRNRGNTEVNKRLLIIFLILLLIVLYLLDFDLSIFFNRKSQ